MEFNSSPKQDMSMLGTSNLAVSVSLWPPASVEVDEMRRRFDCVMGEKTLEWVVSPNWSIFCSLLKEIKLGCFFLVVD